MSLCVISPIASMVAMGTQEAVEASWTSWTMMNSCLNSSRCSIWDIKVKSMRKCSKPAFFLLTNRGQIHRTLLQLSCPNCHVSQLKLMQMAMATACIWKCLYYFSSCLNNDVPSVLSFQTISCPAHSCDILVDDNTVMWVSICADVFFVTHWSTMISMRGKIWD